MGQCDANLFPSRDTTGDAILFIEIKYGRKENTWLNYKESSQKGEFLSNCENYTG